MPVPVGNRNQSLSMKTAYKKVAILSYMVQQKINCRARNTESVNKDPFLIVLGQN